MFSTYCNVASAMLSTLPVSVSCPTATALWGRLGGCCSFLGEWRPAPRRTAGEYESLVLYYVCLKSLWTLHHIMSLWCVHSIQGHRAFGPLSHRNVLEGPPTDKSHPRMCVCPHEPRYPNRASINLVKSWKGAKQSLIGTPYPCWKSPKTHNPVWNKGALFVTNDPWLFDFPASIPTSPSYSGAHLQFWGFKFFF